MTQRQRVQKLIDRAWPGAALLDELRDALTRYLAMPSPEAADAVVLWIAATHAQPAWEHATRLGITGPEKRCGKSRLLDIIAETSHGAFLTVNATTPAIYRSIDPAEPPTLLFDEVDAKFGTRRAAEDNEDLRALLNAGHGRGRPVMRCVGPTQQVQAFPSFAMAALAGIGTLPDTIADRAVNIRMRRRAPDETVAPYRARRDGEPLNHLRDRLHAWIRAHLDALAAAEPDMPVEDRAADTWESLIATADLAGATWPARARRAAQAFTARAAESDADANLNTRLLSDIRDILAETPVAFVPSADLVRHLRSIDDAPWAEFDLTMRKLARRLAEYGVKPRPNPARTTRGYYAEDFADAFERYLPPAPGGEASGSVQASETQSDQREHLDTSEAPGHFEVSGPKQASKRSPSSQPVSDAWTLPDGHPTGTCPECGWPAGSIGCDCHSPQSPVCIACRQPLAHDDGTHTHPTCAGGAA